MNRVDVQLLQSIRGYPAVTITLSTHRTSPANKQDPIRVKNLVKEATERLLGEFSRREIEPVLARLEKLTEEIDYRYVLDGLAMFVNHDIAQKYYLPFSVSERVVIDETFATRDLVRALYRIRRYWVLALSEKPTRLFEGVKDDLVEVENVNFPMTHTGAGGETALPGGPEAQRSAYRDEKHRQFFRQVDAAFAPLAAADPLPLAVVGVDRYLAFFRELSKHQNLIITTLPGNHDKTAAHDLADLVWPLVKENLDGMQMTYLQELDTAVGQRLFVAGIEHAWRMAQEGRVRTLLVDETYHVPGRVDETGLNLTVVEDREAPNVIDDAVDDLIEIVMEKGGQVHFLDAGKLDEYRQIAAITRY